MFNRSEAASQLCAQTRSGAHRNVVAKGFSSIHQDILREVALQSEKRRLDRAIKDKETAAYDNQEGMLVAEAFEAFVDSMENALRRRHDRATKAGNNFFNILWANRDLSGRPF